MRARVAISAFDATSAARCSPRAVRSSAPEHRPRDPPRRRLASALPVGRPPGPRGGRRPTCAGTAGCAPWASGRVVGNGGHGTPADFNASARAAPQELRRRDAASSSLLDERGSACRASRRRSALLTRVPSPETPDTRSVRYIGAAAPILHSPTHSSCSRFEVTRPMISSRRSIGLKPRSARAPAREATQRRPRLHQRRLPAMQVMRAGAEPPQSRRALPFSRCAGICEASGPDAQPSPSRRLGDQSHRPPPPRPPDWSPRHRQPTAASTTCGSSSAAATQPGSPSRSPTPSRTCSGSACSMIVRARDMKAWEYQPLGPFLSKKSPPRSRRGSLPRLLIDASRQTRRAVGRDGLTSATSCR